MENDIPEDLHYIEDVKSVNELQSILEKMKKENTILLQKKRFEIDRLVEEISYITDELKSQSVQISQYEKRSLGISLKLKDIEKEQTVTLLDMLKLKEAILLKNHELGDLKETFGKHYKENKITLRDCLKLREEIEKIGKDIKELIDEKPRLYDVLSEKIQVKKEKKGELESLQNETVEEIQKREMEKENIEEGKSAQIMKNKQLIQLNLKVKEKKNEILANIMSIVSSQKRE